MKLVRRLLCDKRAITPVLSSLLLTVIAVAAMAIATSATYVITANLKDNMSERVIVEDVWFNNATTRTVDVYMRNIGKVDIRVSGVYVNHTSQSFNSPFPLELNQGDELNIYCDWSSGELYYIDIVTNRGTHVASYYTAP